MSKIRSKRTWILGCLNPLWSQQNSRDADCKVRPRKIMLCETFVLTPVHRCSGAYLWKVFYWKNSWNMTVFVHVIGNSFHFTKNLWKVFCSKKSWKHDGSCKNARFTAKNSKVLGHNFFYQFLFSVLSGQQVYLTTILVNHNYSF